MNDYFNELLESKRVVDLAMATAPVHGGHTGSGHTVTSGTGIGTGTITIPGYTGGAGNITVNSNYVISGHGFIGYQHGSPAVPKLKSQSADLPPITMEGYDEIGNKVTLTLAPENGISVQELKKVMMLCMSYANAKEEFSALAYIKANNLERHFKFS